MSVIEEIRREREDLAHVLKKHTGIRNLVEDLYPDRAHFIYELLQNAEDTGASDVAFVLSEKSLVFEHNGQPFEKQDIEGITDIGGGTKKDEEEKIGRFGIGFKAVFAYSETPYIWSPTFSFKLSDLVLPTEIESDSSLNEKTRFKFPFNNPKKSASDAFSEIRAGLQAISETTLLFLSHMESIHWRVEGIKEIIEGHVLRIGHSENHIETLKETGGEKTESSHFLRFTEPVEGLQKKQHIAVSFALHPLPEASKSETVKSVSDHFKIMPAVPGRVAVFFSAEKETSGLRFHLHAPFVPEISRASIKDTPANEPLFQQLAALTKRSLFTIRDLGLLNAEFLAVLPNPNDDLPKRYECIRDAIVTAMNEQSLTPTTTNTHAPAKRLLQAKASLKALLGKEDIELLFDFDEEPPDWAVAATQRNSDLDRFLSGLNIREWDVENFVAVLEEGLYGEYDSCDETLLKWLSSKSDEWLQRLYALLYRESELDISGFNNLCLVRISSGEYRRGRECYFPKEDSQEDKLLPRVAMGTYTSGRSKPEKDNARKFLEAIRVREVGEYEEIEAVLRLRYSEESEPPGKKKHERDISRFIFLAESDQKAASLFKDYRIFKRRDDSWGRPDEVYLDEPYLNTGLDAFFGALRNEGNNQQQLPLANNYRKGRISRDKFPAFAKTVGAQTSLIVTKQSTLIHSMRSSLREDSYMARARLTSSNIDDDWTIAGLKEALAKPSENLSRLIWRTLTEADESVLKAQFRPNQQYTIRTEPSTLVLTLKELQWIPQGEGKFVRPAAATRDLLPEGFPFDRGLKWIKAVGFGEENDKRVEEEQRESEVAKELGFENEETLNDARRFAKLSVDDRRHFWLEYDSRQKPSLPEQEPINPERRSTKVAEQSKEAPERVTEKRLRSVPITREEVKSDTRPYLCQQYTNDDGIMICQVCRKALPFKLTDGNYFYEAVEFLPELQRRHYQNYLALCPNHAAMYLYANGATEIMKELFMDMEENELEIVLADEDTIVYFTKTHVADLRAIIAAELSS